MYLCLYCVRVCVRVRIRVCERACVCVYAGPDQVNHRGGGGGGSAGGPGGRIGPLAGSRGCFFVLFLLEKVHA